MSVDVSINCLQVGKILINGNTILEDGHVNYDGTAWWKERTITEHVGLTVLSRGAFNFTNCTFNGSWLVKDTMDGGNYTLFEATENNNYVGVDSGEYEVVLEATAVQVINDGHHTNNTGTLPYATANATANPIIPHSPPDPRL